MKIKILLVLETVQYINQIMFIFLGFDANPYIHQISTMYLQDHLWRLPVSNEYLQFIQKNQPYNQHASREQLHCLTLESLSLTDDMHQNEALLNQLEENQSQVTLTVETLNYNIQSICLLLEGFAVHAYVLQSSYNVYLIQTLYPILEKVGSSNASIHHTAMQVLTDISRYCNYESVSDLILFNSDYLINSVALQFRHMMLGTAAPAVLSVILKLCDRDIMSVVCDATADVFRILDEYQEEIADSMLEVLKQFAMSVDRWFCGNVVGGGDLNIPSKEKDVEQNKVFFYIKS